MAPKQILRGHAPLAPTEIHDKQYILLTYLLTHSLTHLLCGPLISITLIQRNPDIDKAYKQKNSEKLPLT